jgi:DNA-binding winged helix-turn-helix (wHTH) protein/TolB-like protein
MTDPSTHRAHRFGPFAYDASERILLRDGQPVPLEPKILDTLEALLDKRGQVVEKAELVRRVWPDTVVEDAGLSRNISLLRKALDDDAGTYIETVPKRGYRFTAATPPIAAPPATPEPLPTPPRRTRSWIAEAAIVLAVLAVIYWQFYLPSRFLPDSGDSAVIAVIPLDPLSPELAQSAFPEAFNSAFVAELAASQGVQLISPSTVHRYRRLGIPNPVMTRVLGVQVIVEGTAQLSGDKLRTVLRVTDVHSGRLIWAGAFDAPASDPAQAQTDIARTAAGQIVAILHRKP